MDESLESFRVLVVMLICSGIPCILASYMMGGFCQAYSIGSISWVDVTTKIGGISVNLKDNWCWNRWQIVLASPDYSRAEVAADARRRAV
jgi:hypothetical protein